MAKSQTDNTDGPTILKKLAPATVCGDILDAFSVKKPCERQCKLMRVAGYISDITTIRTQFGESARISGDFTAERASDGKRFTSTTVFLPPVGEILAKNAWNGGKEGNASIVIDLFIGPPTSDKNTSGYEYTAVVVSKDKKPGSTSLLDSMPKD